MITIKVITISGLHYGNCLITRFQTGAFFRQRNSPRSAQASGSGRISGTGVDLSQDLVHRRLFVLPGNFIVFFQLNFVQWKLLNCVTWLFHYFFQLSFVQ
jgi:hypothetical protein